MQSCDGIFASGELDDHFSTVSAIAPAVLRGFTEAEMETMSMMVSMTYFQYQGASRLVLNCSMMGCTKGGALVGPIEDEIPRTFASRSSMRWSSSTFSSWAAVMRRVVRNDVSQLL